MRLLLTLFGIINCLSVFGQGTSDFDTFLDKFNQPQQSLIQLSADELDRYFDVKLDSLTGGVASADRILFKTDHLIGIVCVVDCSAGGMCQYRELNVLDLKGHIRGRLSHFEYDFADCGYSKRQKCSFQSDTLIVVLERKEKYANCDEVVNRELLLKSYRILPDGKIEETEVRSVNSSREYYVTSTELLGKKDLVGKSKEELAIIRNEIFAAHGYVFKSKKWKTYFDEKPWYEAKYVDVTSYLSVIEKKNIDLLLQCEDRLK
ncbi:YARHG domain-containing protein [Persicobacter psychrovividus]|uniref:YARHG domain-containing protein n=1 Tax=Persicobacter psychrovividus TaxID=387638 RepID=A0ABM7VFY9_9BACT|nr:hypothetical protein PEPS_21600 [Persicobacter psychrovividus]